MKKPIQNFFNNEILAYLFFGLATTLVSILSRLIRLVKFFLARLSTFLLDLLFTFLFVTQFPHIIGQFVNENLDKVNAIETIIAQILIIIINYILSKVYIFRK